MSINRDMKRYIVQHDEQVRSPSGAPKSVWTDAGTIMAAVYFKDETTKSGSEIYKETTHIGLTHDKEIKSKVDRLVNDGIVYQILSCNPYGRLTQILLKVIQDG